MDSKDLILQKTAATVYTDFKTHIAASQPTCINGCDLSGCTITYPNYQYRLLISQGKKACNCC